MRRKERGSPLREGSGPVTVGSPRGGSRVPDGPEPVLPSSVVTDRQPGREDSRGPDGGQLRGWIPEAGRVVTDRVRPGPGSSADGEGPGAVPVGARRVRLACGWQYMRVVVRVAERRGTLVSGLVFSESNRPPVRLFRQVDSGCFRVGGVMIHQISVALSRKIHPPGPQMQLSEYQRIYLPAHPTAIH